MGKIISLLLFLCLLSLKVFSQQTTIAKFIITDATINKLDATESYLNAGGYIVFYTASDPDELFMANIMVKRNTQSYGRLYSARTRKMNETYQTYKSDILYFNWHYSNSYDNKSGTASVELIKIYKPQGVTFICKLILENLDVLVYKGYLDGSLNFSDY